MGVSSTSFNWMHARRLAQTAQLTHTHTHIKLPEQIHSGDQISDKLSLSNLTSGDTQVITTTCRTDQFFSFWVWKRWELLMFQLLTRCHVCYTWPRRLQRRWELPGQRLLGGHHAVHPRTLLLWGGVEHNHQRSPTTQDGTQHGGFQRWDMFLSTVLQTWHKQNLMW